MASRTGALATLATSDSVELVITLSRCLVRVTLGLLLLLFAVLLLRHRAGMFQQPVPAGGLVAVGVFLTVLFAWFHGIQWQRFTQSRLTLGRYLEWCGPLLLAVLVTLSISLPGSSPAALAVMWSLLGASEVGWTTAVLIIRRRQQTGNVAPSFATADISTDSQFDLSDSSNESVEVPAAELIQQMTRRLRTDGGESILVSTQASFEAEQRTATVHLAFCPPLEEPPVIECHQLDGPPCRIKTAESQVYGARFDVRLLERWPHPMQVQFQVEAQTSAPVR
ncbi:MAG: hypothetical protein VB857_04095 [Pirellulaceae bacterium]